MSRSVEFHPTPNPNAGKFTVGTALTEEGPRSFSSFADAAEEPFARALLELPGVRSVFTVADFVTVSKAPEADWDALVPAVVAVLEEHL